MLTNRPVRLTTLLVMLITLASTVSARDVSLDGAWTVRLDVDDRGSREGWKSPDHSVWSTPPQADQREDTIAVPSALEATLGPYDGVAWYRREFEAPTSKPDDALWMLAFDNANDRVDVWWNGEHLGRHDGSDAPFRFDVDGLVQRAGGSTVTITVRCVDPGMRAADGLLLMARPHAKESWYYNYGGLVGSVALRATPRLEVTTVDVWIDDSGVPHADVFVDDHRAEHDTIDIHVALGEAEATTTATATSTPTTPSATVALAAAAALSRWSPASPDRHELTVTLRSGGSVHTTTTLVGLRRFEVDGTHFVLNGEVVRPIGVLYQPLHPRGLSNPPDAGWIRREMEAIKAAGFDMVRAHIRVMPEVYEVCDEIGLLVHAEPTLGWVQRERPDTWPAVDVALVAAAEEFRGHASVVMVGMLNELSGILYKRVETLHERFAALLPHHLILDDSGSWLGVAHYRNPDDSAAVAFDDEHVYRAWPWTSKDIGDAAALGFDKVVDADGVTERERHDRLVYVSEYGFGGLPHFVAAAQGFAGEHWRHDGGDAIAMAVEAAEGLASTPLGQVAGSLDALAEIGGRNQARAAEVMTQVLVANERVAALVYTQWRDVAWECGAGLVDTWGNPKPALESFTQMLTGTPATRTLDVAPSLPPRPTLPVARVRWIDVDDDVRAALEPHTLPLDAPRPDLPELAIVGARVAPWGPDNIAETLALWRWIESGGVAWMMAPAGYPYPELIFGYDGLGHVAELPFTAQMSNARGHFIGTHHVILPGSPLHTHLPWTSPLLDERLAPIAPHRVLAVEGVAHVRADALAIDGYGLYLGASAQTVPYGEGRALLTTLRLTDDVLAHPPSRRVLENTLRHAALTAHERRGQITPHAWDATLVVPADTAKALGRAVWRHKVFFSLAERLAVQRFDGRRLQRRDLDDLDEIVAGKNAGLRAAIGGDLDAAVAQLDDVETHMTLARELFMRREFELSRALHRPAGAPAPLRLADTVSVAHAHAVALRLMRAGAHDAAMKQLDEAFEKLAAARAAASVDR